ncbi:hypothetical protein [Microbacterium aureliae]
MTDGARAGLQWGLDDAGIGYTIERLAAVEAEAGWFVAAHVVGEAGDTDAVWWTTQDPTTASDAAYLSVDAVAAVASSFVMPENLSGTDPVEAALDCLG